MTGRLRPYVSIARMSFRVLSAYRVNLIATVVGALTLIGVHVALWSSVYASDATPGGMTFVQTATYAVIARAWSYVVPGFRSADEFEERVRSGDIAYDLILPGSFIGRRFADDAGRAAGSLLFVAVPTLVFALALLRPGGSRADATHLLLAVASLASGFVIAFALGGLIGLTCFFVRRVRGLNELRAALVTVAGGSLVPLSFYPPALAEVLQWLPFVHIYYTPLAWLVGDPLVQPSDVARGVAWGVALVAIASFALRAVRTRLVLDGG